MPIESFTINDVIHKPILFAFRIIHTALFFCVCRIGCKQNLFVRQTLPLLKALSVKSISVRRHHNNPIFEDPALPAFPVRFCLCTGIVMHKIDPDIPQNAYGVFLFPAHDQFFLEVILKPADETDKIRFPNEQIDGGRKKLHAHFVIEYTADAILAD